MIGNPTEVILVRMCADAAKPAAERFGYSDAMTGLYRIGKEEGVRVFGRGLSANVVRSVIMSKSPCPCHVWVDLCADRVKDVSQIAP
jgi:dicarboxylate transporter 10